jgi:hypothetical protein
MRVVEVHISDGEYRVGQSGMSKTQFIVNKLIDKDIPAYSGINGTILVSYGNLISNQHPRFPLATVYEWRGH